MLPPRVWHNKGHGALRVHLSVHGGYDLYQVGVSHLVDLEQLRLCGDGQDDELWRFAEGEIVELTSRRVERVNVV